jgi:hypothetical protein
VSKRKIDTDSLAIPSIGKTLRYIEWIAIATSAIAILVNGILLDDKSYLPRVFPDLVVLILVLCLAPFFYLFSSKYFCYSIELCYSLRKTQ